MIEDKTLKMLSFIAPYAILICVLYLFGYWSSFGINILEFISFSDVVKLGIYPVAIGAIAFLLGLLSSYVFPRRVSQKDVNNNDSSKRINKYLLLASFLMFIAFLVILYFRSDPFFWQAAGLFTAGLLMVIIKDIKFLKPIIPNRNVRSFVLAAGIGLLPISFGIGKANAQKILSGKSVKVVSTQIFKEKGTDLFKDKGLLEGQERLKFVGAAGDYFFFLTLDNSTVYVVKYSDMHFLELKALN